MTIDEVILHAREVAEKNKRLYKNCPAELNTRGYTCGQCAEEHAQLVEWLEELKRYKDTETAYEQECKKVIKKFTQMLRNEFDRVLSFEYNLNFKEINGVIDNVFNRIVEED